MKKRENKSRIRMDVITPPTPPPPPPPHQCTAPAREHKKEKTKVAFAWTSSPPPPHPLPTDVPHQHVNTRKRKQKAHSHGRHHPSTPQTELKQKCKSKPACAESRESAKYCENPCRMRHTHRKTPKKTMRNAEVNTFLHSAARRLGHFLAIKHRINRCESRSKVQFRVSKVRKLEFQHMPAKESHHPARQQTQRLPRTTTATTTTTTNQPTQPPQPEQR